MFEDEADARKFCNELASEAAPPVLEEKFVVWSGKSTGVMSAADCLVATKGFKGASAEGPMPAAAAMQLWNSGKQKSASARSSTAATSKPEDEATDAAAAPAEAATGNVEHPSQAQWERALASGQTRVFAC